MRKIMFLMALLMTATWMFTSCTDEENGDDGKIPPEEVPGTEEQQLIYSFVKERDALSSEVVIGIELKNIDGTNYIATEDIHLPFVFSDASTAILGTHFSVKDDVTEFVVPKGKMNATITLEFLELEEGMDKIVMNVDAGEQFVAGNYDEMTITIYGPTTVGKLFGKWVYKSDNLESEYDQYIDWGYDLGNRPLNNSVNDTLEFVQEEEAMLVCHLSGDMKNYFRDAVVTPLQDTTIQVGSNEFVTYSLMNLSVANVKFDASMVEEREVQIAFRILEDESLEVTVYDYEPANFFGDFYQNLIDYPEYYWLMWDAKIQYIFTKVEE